MINIISSGDFSLKGGEHIKAVYLAVFMFMIVDRMMFDRDLYADGSCIYLYLQLEGVINQPLFSRLAAIGLLHFPSIFLSYFGVDDIGITRIVWKIGYIVPFVFAILALRLLSEKNKDFGLIYLLFSIIVFYLPNSLFAVGEYQIIYAITPVVLAATKELLESYSRSSAIITLTCLILLSKVYEIAVILSITICVFILITNLIMFFKRGILRIPKVDSLIFLGLLIVLIYTLYVDIRYMPEWLKINSKAGFSTYLFDSPNGALWDSWTVFQLAVSLSLAFIYLIRSESKGGLLLGVIIFFASAASLFLNHQPAHSYFSKTFFLAIYVGVSVLFLLIRTGDVISSPIISMLTPIFFAVAIYVLWQGFAYQGYIRTIHEIASDKSAKGNIRAADHPYFKTNIGARYSWSWGHACISFIGADRAAMVIGELDDQYAPEKIKQIIKMNYLND
jgi:hypothetical protein